MSKRTFIFIAIGFSMTLAFTGCETGGNPQSEPAAAEATANTDSSASPFADGPLELQSWLDHTDHIFVDAANGEGFLAHAAAPRETGATYPGATTLRIEAFDGGREVIIDLMRPDGSVVETLTAAVEGDRLTLDSVSNDGEGATSTFDIRAAEPYELMTATIQGESVSPESAICRLATAKAASILAPAAVTVARAFEVGTMTGTVETEYLCPLLRAMREISATAAPHPGPSPDAIQDAFEVAAAMSPDC